MPLLPPITPHHPIDFLIGGEFHQDSRYRNYRPCGTDDWLLIYTIGGAGRITGSNGRSFHAGVGSTIIYAPGCPQRYDTAGAPGTWSILWFHFHPRPHWSGWLQGVRRTTNPWRGSSLGSSHTQIVHALRQSLAALNQNRRWSEDWAAHHLETALLLLLGNADSASSTLRDPRIIAAMDWMNTHLMCQPQVADLARQVGLSASRFAHLFQKQVGESPIAWMEKLRLRSARQHLAYSSEPIGEIAYQHGFDDPFYFSKRFRKLFHTSPSQFRKRIATCLPS